jgi:periplasmic copper chaperone A
VPNLKPLLLGLALSLAFGSAATAQQGPIVIEAPWARATPPGAPSAAGYLTIRNAGDRPDRLMAAASPRAGRVELHETAIADGVARMRQLAGGLAVPPGQAVVLEPSGRHLMFRELNEGLTAGEQVPVTLSFEVAGMVEVELRVVPIGAGPPAPGHDAAHDAAHDGGHEGAHDGAHDSGHDARHGAHDVPR